MNAFERLIKWMPRGYEVLDVGCGGLYGENNSRAIAKQFKHENILGVCFRQETNSDFQRFKVEHPNIKVLDNNFYQLDFEKLGKFDLVLLDLNIENNTGRDWSDEGLARAWHLLKPGGYLINYVMMTDQYGEPETPELIREHWRNWWGGPIAPMTVGNKLYSLRQWEVVATEKEERRPYILWVLLKKR